MKPIKPIYINLLIITGVIWIVSMTFYISSLYQKVGEIEHTLVHATFGRTNK